MEILTAGRIALTRMVVCFRTIPAFWCRYAHTSIVNLTASTYECGRCGIVHRYDWWAPRAPTTGLETTQRGGLAREGRSIDRKLPRTLNQG